MLSKSLSLHSKIITKSTLNSNENTCLTITRPDDWHLHARNDTTLKAVIQHTARVFGRAIIMPNLNPPVRTVKEALEYRDRIIEAVPQDYNFKPLMTLYLTENTTPNDIITAVNNGNVVACKLYPAGATTNSSFGVKNIDNCMDTLSTMEQLGMPLLVHGEVSDHIIDIFDREKVFLEQKLDPLRQKFPFLKIVFEHATTKEAVDYVKSNENIGCTITPQHLLFNRNAMFQGGIRPHHYCLPVLKREKHRKALVEAVTSGNSKFFLGTDSAPHPKSVKESGCGCAGVYSAHAALPFYAHVFEQANALDKLEGFVSLNGPAFYGMLPNVDTVTLMKKSWIVPKEYDIGDSDTLVPLCAGEELQWQVVV